MSQEILYTSAPQGLKPGSRGFCTVVSTSGMAKTLAERLESLSGYRHAYPQHDPRAAMNPVNYSHVVLSVGGRTYHVLSRVGDAGSDYTKRSNKLAHLVALEPRELVSGGPAWVLAGEGFCETAWDGSTKILPAGRRPRTDDCPTAICRHWAKLAGDAGWAGVLAESILANSKKPMSVIFKPNTDTLPLVVEAMSLLPPERRWTVTFSTYFTQSQSGVECQWRFLLDGTPEARAARRNPHAPLIDLCKPLGKASGGELVALARSGRRPRPAAGGAAPQPSQAEETVDLRRPNGPPAPRGGAGHALAGGQAGAVPPPLAGAGLSFPVVRDPLAPRRRSKSPMIAVAIAVFLVMALGMFGAYYAGTRTQVAIAVPPLEEESAGESSSAPDPAVEPPPPRAPASDSPEDAPVDDAADATPEDDRAPEEATAEGTHEPDERTDSLEASEDEEEPPVEPSGQPEPSPPPDGSGDDAEPAPPTDPFGDIAARGHVLPLPKREFQPAGEGTRSAELAQLVVSCPKDCNLAILGDQHVLDDVRFEVDAADEPGARTWTVRPKVPGVFVPPQPIGTFALKDGALAFTWNPRAPASAQPGHLRYCLLKLEVEGRSVRCRLSEPLEADPPSIDWSTTRPSAPIGITEAALPRAENLRLDLVPQGFPPHELAGASGMKVDDVRRLRVPDEGGELPLVKMEVCFQLEPAPSLSFELFMYPRRGDGVSDKVTRDRERLTRNRLDGLTREAKTAIEYCKKRILEATRHRDVLNERKARIDTDIAELTKARDKYRQWTDDEQLPMPQRDKAEHARVKCDGQIKMLKENRHAVAHKRAALENEINGLNRWKTFAEENLAWCMRVRAALDQMEKKGRMGFALYVEVEGERVDILRTRGN